ncbi:MAG TPA: DUF6265 family protein [Allosphingosinicella sp.]
MRAGALLIGFAAVLTAAAAPAVPPPGVAALAWMSGDWAEEKAGGWTQESWSRPRGGAMLGTSLSGRGGQARDFEFMRIAADADGTLTYWASPRGVPAVPFRLTSASAGAAVFENPRHDYPTRIAYRRQGNVLTATIAGPGGANPMSWRYRRVGK